MPLNIRPLSPELEAIAMKELNEVPERREADVKHMRDWLKKQPHIRADPDDQTLISFLRGCKFSLERTKEKLDMYYTMRTALPEFFKNRSTKDKGLRDILEQETFIPLPGTDPNGCRVVLGRFGHTIPDNHKIEDSLKLNTMMMDLMILDDDVGIINGSVNLLDMSGMTLAHMSQWNPSIMKKMMVLFQEAYPFRPKGINYVHNPAIFQTLFNVIKAFSKEKLRKRLALHGDDMESLYKKIPQDLLPTEYGGHAGTIKELNDALIQKLDSYNAWFEADGKNGVDESKRPGKPKTQQDLFGLEGSFRQLNVD